MPTLIPSITQTEIPSINQTLMPSLNLTVDPSLMPTNLPSQSHSHSHSKKSNLFYLLILTVLLIGFILLYIIEKTSKNKSEKSDSIPLEENIEDQSVPLEENIENIENIQNPLDEDDTIISMDNAIIDSSFDDSQHIV